MRIDCISHPPHLPKISKGIINDFEKTTHSLSTLSDRNMAQIRKLSLFAFIKNSIICFISDGNFTLVSEVNTAGSDDHEDIQNLSSGLYMVEIYGPTCQTTVMEFDIINSDLQVEANISPVCLLGNGSTDLTIKGGLGSCEVLS